MDAVRFGRALGFGARQAAKTVVAAVDAATANPSGSEARTSPEDSTRIAAGSSAVVIDRMHPVRPTMPADPMPVAVSQARKAQRGFLRGSRRFGQAAFSPFIRLSGVVMLEVAGVFFGIFALYGLSTVLRLRSEWHNGMPHHRQWLGGLLMLAVFGYFCVSSFVRARRRERGR